VGRSVELMCRREGAVEWGEELDVGEFAGIEVLETLWESENHANATSAVSFIVRYWLAWCGMSRIWNKDSR
jgi:hypothetical protein